MSFEHLNKFKRQRQERLGIGFIIIEERPEKYFTEEEWCQYFRDDFTAWVCIENYLPIPEDVEIRLLKAKAKIDLYFAEAIEKNKHWKRKK